MAASWDLRKLQESLAKRKPGSLYLIFGEDEFLIQEATEQLKENSLKDIEVQDFNYDRLFANEASGAKVRDIAETLPMMAQRRLVIVRDVNRWKEADWQNLWPVLEEPIVSTTLILLSDKVDKRKKYFKKITERGVTVELRRPFDNQVPAWIGYIAQKKKVKLSPKAAQLLFEFVGNNLIEIQNEVVKLSQYSGPDKVVEEGDVRSVVSRSKTHKIFDLTNALGRKDRSVALEQLANLLEHGQSEVGALALINRHFKILGKVKTGVQGGATSQQLSQSIGIPQFFVKDYVSQSRYWDVRKLDRALDAIYDTEKALKSSPASSHIWLENFVLQTCAL